MALRRHPLFFYPHPISASPRLLFNSMRILARCSWTRKAKGRERTHTKRRRAHYFIAGRTECRLSRLRMRRQGIGRLQPLQVL